MKGIFWLAATALGWTLSINAVQAKDWDSTLFLESRLFSESPKYSGQERNNFSVALESEYYTDFDGSEYALTFKPFVRYDSADDERSHADIREAVIFRSVGDWEWRAGLSKVFWGVTESRHLVDVVNQTDAVEGADGEAKLGQPMIRATLVKDWGELDMFVLPYFRERTFAGESGRLRPALLVDSDNAVFESSREEKHVDAAIRWSQTFGDWDVGLSYFDGTSRDPRMVYESTPSGGKLVPHYDQISQYGLDVQAIFEGWIWKLEAMSRRSNVEDNTAVTAGFEYTVVGIFDSITDLGLLMEYHNDSRGEDADTIFQDDVFLGGRWALNDVEGSEVLGGVLLDMNDSSQSWRVEASRRLSNNWALAVEGQVMLNVDEDNLMADFEADDFLKLEFKRYF